jgi:hypothetical protein
MSPGRVMAEHELMALAADVEEMHVSENQAVKDLKLSHFPPVHVF